jgi:membrane protein
MGNLQSQVNADTPAMRLSKSSDGWDWRAKLLISKDFVLAFSQKIIADDCPGLAAEMAYHLILSLTPFLLFLTALSGLFGGHHDVEEATRDLIMRFAPVQAIDLLKDGVSAIINGSSAGLTVFGFVGTLWSSSGAAGIVVKGLHRSYQLSKRRFPFWYGPVLSLCVILSLGMVSIMATYLLMFGNFISGLVSSYFLIVPPWDIWVNLLRWSIILIGIRWGARFAYTLALRPRTGYLAWRLTSVGSWFFVFAWVVGSWLFSLYINNLHQFNPVYGSLGVLIILVTWFYYSAFIFFMGAALTALCVERQEAKAN